MLIEDLNIEINYKLGEVNDTADQDLLLLQSIGKRHTIYFQGLVIWDSQTERELEKIPAHVEINLNERENFEKHLRLLIMDRINILKHLEL